MKLGSTYLIVKDFEKSLSFYEKLFEMKVSSQNMNRWAEFYVDGGCIALFNPLYDEHQIREGKNVDSQYSKEYLEMKEKFELSYGNNYVLNFSVDSLKIEHKRISNLSIGEVSEIMFLNTYMPYYFFNVTDPDGNIIEIAGGMQ